MQPLMIIATPNICWLKPEVDYPRTSETIARKARLCFENGATILHTHAEGKWKETIAGSARQERNHRPVWHVQPAHPGPDGSLHQQSRHDLHHPESP